MLRLRKSRTLSKTKAGGEKAGKLRTIQPQRSTAHLTVTALITGKRIFDTPEMPETIGIPSPMSIFS